ncbi:MAG: acetylxylan esterase [Verrucomicrobia bacterium]|nr:acetylxylan esterase [Verrucomicrobiota bacterium]
MSSTGEWAERQKQIKRRIKVSAGLWPMPEKTPLNAVIHGKKDMGDYTVEKVYFESLPGHFVTGNLYRPAGDSLKNGVKDGKRPGALCPHGHWKDARFYDLDEKKRKQLIAIGAERFDSAAQNHYQARCVQLARMGLVVFQYDMLGNSDSNQFLEHRRGPRDHMNNPEPGKWGLVSPQAEARLQTNFGLQTWNSVRALDFLLDQEQIDAKRILVTGASGGATQTMMISAIDERVGAAFPAVMVSTAMQGGCTGENGFYLRIGQGNIDIAAAVAPRPLAITAADDWTIDLKEKGVPDLMKLYELAGAKGKFEAHLNTWFKHNYNHLSRTQMYNFVNKHFQLGLKTPVLERDFTVLLKPDLSVWDENHPAPKQVGDDHERAVCKWFTEDSTKQITPLLSPKNKADLAKAREVIGGAVDIMIGRKLPLAEDVNFDLSDKKEKSGYMELTGVIQNKKHSEEIPAAFAQPENWKGKIVIWVFPEGKSGMFQADGKLSAGVKKLVDAGIGVMSPDLFRQGEFLKPDEKSSENARVQYPGKTDKPDQKWRMSGVYNYGYNDSLFSRRVHDILTCVAYVKNYEKLDVKSVDLVGLEGAGQWVAAAAAVAGSEIDHTVAITDGFRFASLSSSFDQNFLPGATKYGDIGAFLTLNAPQKLWLLDSDKNLQAQVKSTFTAADAEKYFQIYQGDKAQAQANWLEFLMK